VGGGSLSGPPGEPLGTWGRAPATAVPSVGNGMRGGDGFHGDCQAHMELVPDRQSKISVGLAKRSLGSRDLGAPASAALGPIGGGLARGRRELELVWRGRPLGSRASGRGRCGAFTLKEAARLAADQIHSLQASISKLDVGAKPRLHRCKSFSLEMHLR
jgi:hypothetical protein